MVHVRPLGALEATFLYLDTPRTPMHLGSVAIFEAGPLCDAHGRIQIEALRAHVEERIDLVPKLRRRVKFSVLGEAAPTWVDDTDFDVASHMHVVAVPEPGTMDQLAELSAQILAEPLASDFPLWELWFVEGLAGGRVGLIEKLHHSLADGLAGVELAAVLLDTTRRPVHRPPDAEPWRPEPVPSERALVAGDLAARRDRARRGARRVVRGLTRPMTSVRAGLKVADALATLATPRLIAPRSSINGRIGQARRVAFVRVALDHLVDVERAYEVTVNDVVLAAVTGGLRRLLLGRGEHLVGRELQVLVPVSVPSAAGHEPAGHEPAGHEPAGHELGNNVSAMLARLPVGIEDPAERLRAVGASTSRAKAHHQALAGEVILGVAGILPQPALAAVARVVQHQPVANLVVTNVPGPSVPLYAHGAKMLEAYPIVPLAGNLSIGVAALSYDGQMHIGLYADRDRCPDLEVLADGIRRSIEELVPERPGGGGPGRVVVHVERQAVGDGRPRVLGRGRSAVAGSSRGGERR